MSSKIPFYLPGVNCITFACRNLRSQITYPVTKSGKHLEKTGGGGGASYLEISTDFLSLRSPRIHVPLAFTVCHHLQIGFWANLIVEVVLG